MRRVTMPKPIIGFIGFGEAAYLISKGLKSEGIEKQFAYDVNANHATFGAKIHEHIKQNGTTLTHSLDELCKQSDVIFCATSAKVAESIAKDVKQFLTSKHFYIDINASSPMAQEKIARYIAESHAKFVDAAVMESVPLNKHKAPMFLSGNGAKEFQTLGSMYGMNLKFISEIPGRSSAIKMFRSIFMKGITSLLFETLQASDKYDVSELVMASLNTSMTQKSLEDTANMLITRTAIHSERRVAEISEVIKTLDMLNIDSTLSKAIKLKLQSVTNSGIKERLNNEVPEDYNAVLKVLRSNETV